MYSKDQKPTPVPVRQDFLSAVAEQLTAYHAQLAAGQKPLPFAVMQVLITKGQPSNVFNGSGTPVGYNSRGFVGSLADICQYERELTARMRTQGSNAKEEIKMHIGAVIVNGDKTASELVGRSLDKLTVIHYLPQ